VEHEEDLHDEEVKGEMKCIMRGDG